MLLLDGNCRLGSVTSVSVGDLHADEEDFAAAFLHEMLLLLRCWVPSTFATHMKGPEATLVMRGSGELHRSDYVGIPLGWRDAQVQAVVDPQVSAGHANADHFAVVVQFQVRRGCTGLGRTPRVDAANPDNHARVLEILHCIGFRRCLGTFLLRIMRPSCPSSCSGSLWMCSPCAHDECVRPSFQSPLHGCTDTLPSSAMPCVIVPRHSVLLC